MDTGVCYTETKRSKALELGGIRRADGKCSIATMKLLRRNRGGGGGGGETLRQYLAQTGKFSRQEVPRFSLPRERETCQRNGFVDFAG